MGSLEALFLFTLIARFNKNFFAEKSCRETHHLKILLHEINIV